ncbi:MAG: hypothetical protein JSS81_11500 [Acidobacteria bacterium]|nr:hypothetical protein [Acidobacteriota bacterium]
MKIKPLILLFLTVFALSAAVFAQSSPIKITGGRFLITGTPNGEAANNAVLETENFTAISLIGGMSSPWFGICQSDPFGCGLGKTKTVPQYSRIEIGGCVGDCTQFVSGPFTINGTTYQNVYYRGYLDFEPVSLFIHRMLRRKGSVFFNRPFTLTGRLQVCEVNDFNQTCPADKILFSGGIVGHGVLTATFEIKNVEGLRPYPVTYLQQQSFEYRFEQ